MEKGIFGGALQERMAFQLERDQLVVGFVEKYQVVDIPLLVALLGFAPTPQNLQLAERLLRRLAKDGHFRYVEQSGKHFAISFAFSLRKTGAKFQLPHRAMAARRRATLDQAFTFDQHRSGESIRAQRYALVPDDFYRLRTYGLLCEDETGSHTTRELVEKSTRYYETQDNLKRLYGVTTLRIVWSLHIWKQVPRLVEALQEAGVSSEMFLVCHHDSTFDPAHAARLVTWPLFYCPKDNATHPLLED